MELIITLAVIVAFIEYREFQRSKKDRALKVRLMAMNRKMDQLSHKAEEIRADLALQAMQSKGFQFEISQMKALTEESQRMWGEADANLKTIVREYELNGTPLGYQRKKQQFDYVEGL